MCVCVCRHVGSGGVALTIEQSVRDVWPFHHHITHVIVSRPLVSPPQVAIGPSPWKRWLPYGWNVTQRSLRRDHGGNVSCPSCVTTVSLRETWFSSSLHFLFLLHIKSFSRTFIVKQQQEGAVLPGPDAAVRWFVGRLNSCWWTGFLDLTPIKTWRHWNNRFI